MSSSQAPEIIEGDLIDAAPLAAPRQDLVAHNKRTTGIEEPLLPTHKKNECQLATVKRNQPTNIRLAFTGTTRLAKYLDAVQVT